MGPEEVNSLGPYDLFLGSFTKAFRVTEVYRLVSASRKIWLIAPEYQFEPTDLPQEESFISSAISESEYITTLISSLPPDLSSLRLCIDITGLPRPQLLFLIVALKMKGLRSFDCLYSEPEHYSNAHRTIFSMPSTTENRAVQGYEGNHLLPDKKDILIIGVGFDHDLIARIADTKPESDKYYIFGLPSLRPDMYQQSLLRASEVKTQAEDYKRRHFAPANDPFVTANVLNELLADKLLNRNIYLSPLGTKPQALGFALFYLFECQEKPVSILFPFSERYSQESSTGIARVWRYTVEFPGQ